ncbi:hypothetical protein [Flavobacterium beibuense]|uniref:Lipoprotein n=1 Tax=Flavobacterium beibuense TaxID=657326 RepID=A0A444W7D5_9FLAO|nr:hypothetical protein [Flavobacterium beibuense]RYJ41797.1 hypothetical protein NU09_2722 [Flavobacterium beibuense]
MKKIVVLLALLLLAGCQKEEKKPEADFDMFVFSFATDAANFSIKFTPGDSIYMKTSPVDYFYSVLTEEKTDSVYSIIKEINFAEYDTVYTNENIVDGASFKFYKAKNDTINWIYVYENKTPKKLYEIADKIIELQKGQRWTPFIGKQDFGNLDYIELPNPVN